MVAARQKVRGYLMLAGLLVVLTIALGVFIANANIIRVAGYTRVFATQTTLSRIEDSLVRYAVVRQRLPCPANPALDSSITASAAGYADADATDSTSPSTCTYPAGVVPWRSLGLTVNDVTDSWGRLISYRVYNGTIGLTQAGGASRVNCDTTNGTGVETPPTNGLCSTDNNTLKASFTQHASYPGSAHTKGLTVTDYGTSTPIVAFALLSHGPSGLGGYLPSGTRMTMPGATAADYPNTQPAPAAVIKAAFSSVDVVDGAAGHFDDIVSYKKIDDFVALTKLEARDWPEKTLPTFNVATTTNMTSPSTDPANPHFESSGSATKLTSFTAQQVSFSGGAAETIVNSGQASLSFGACLWWPLTLTLTDNVTPRDLRIYMEFAAIDNASDPFPGLTFGFLGGNDVLGAPTNDTCGTTNTFMTATGANGSTRITVADNSAIDVGMTVVGTGIGTTGTGTPATVSSTSGTGTVFLNVANTSAVNTTVSVANSRLIRRDIGWAGGTVSAYANRFAVEFDTNIDSSSFTNPTVPDANDPTQPHLAIDGSGVTHTSDAESCATTGYGTGCDMPPTTFPLAITTANQVAGQPTINVANASGIVSGMTAVGIGIGLLATVLNVDGTTVTLANNGVPVNNTLTLNNNPVTFAALSSNNFMQNGLSVYHSIRADVMAKGCVSKSGTTGSSGASTVTVPSATQISRGMGVYGRNIALGATVVSIAGNTITLSGSNTAALNEKVDFALLPATIKAATGSSGAATISVADNHGIGIGMAVSGTGISASAKVTNISGTTVTLSSANTSAVSGTLVFTPPSQNRTAAGVSGANTVVVSDTTGIVTGMEVSGFGIGTGATVTAIAGTTLTLSASNTTDVSSVYVRPSQTLLRSWTLSGPACGADPSDCAAMQDLSTQFGRDLSGNTQALHAVSCIATPSPSNSFNDLYFGITTSNRSTNVNTGVGSNLSMRRLTVVNPASP